MSPVWLPATLLIVPVLLGLTLLMAWLEVRFTHRIVAHEVALAWQSMMSPEELEVAIARSVARVATS